MSGLPGCKGLTEGGKGTAIRDAAIRSAIIIVPREKESIRWPAAKRVDREKDGHRRKRKAIGVE